MFKINGEDTIFAKRKKEDINYPAEKVEDAIHETVKLYLEDSKAPRTSFSEHILEENNIEEKQGFADKADINMVHNIAVATAVVHEDKTLLEAYAKAIMQVEEIERDIHLRYKDSDTFTVIKESVEGIVGSIYEKEGE